MRDWFPGASPASLATALKSHKWDVREAMDAFCSMPTNDHNDDNDRTVHNLGVALPSSPAATNGSTPPVSVTAATPATTPVSRFSNPLRQILQRGKEWAWHTPASRFRFPRSNNTTANNTPTGCPAQVSENANTIRPGFDGATGGTFAGPGQYPVYRTAPYSSTGGFIPTSNLAAQFGGYQGGSEFVGGSGLWQSQLSFGHVADGGPGRALGTPVAGVGGGPVIDQPHATGTDKWVGFGGVGRRVGRQDKGSAPHYRRSLIRGFGGPMVTGNHGSGRGDGGREGDVGRELVGERSNGGSVDVLSGGSGARDGLVGVAAAGAGVEDPMEIEL